MPTPDAAPLRSGLLAAAQAAPLAPRGAIQEVGSAAQVGLRAPPAEGTGAPAAERPEGGAASPAVAIAAAPPEGAPGPSPGLRAPSGGRLSGASLGSSKVLLRSPFREDDRAVPLGGSRTGAPGVPGVAPAARAAPAAVGLRSPSPRGASEAPAAPQPSAAPVEPPPRVSLRAAPPGATRDPRASSGPASSASKPSGGASAAASGRGAAEGAGPPPTQSYAATSVWRAPVSRASRSPTPPSQPSPPPAETESRGAVSERQVLQALRTLAAKSPEARQLLREVGQQLEELRHLERLRQL